MEFKDLPLDIGLAKGIDEAGYITCTPVQEQVLTAALDGADLYVQSQTGTGKTAAYLITILQRLSSDVSVKGKKALIMVPTRELAVQVEDEARLLAKHTPLNIASFYGGVGYGRQTEQLKSGVDVLIGTPGRVIDLQESGSMDLKDVAFLVIDEADRMFDMGFYPDLRTLIKVLSKAKNRQTMLFSATLNTYVKNLAWEYTVDALEITIDCDTITVDEIEQHIIHVSSNEKMRLLLGLLAKEKPESVIVFCNTKRMSEIIAKRLKINGFECEFIIGDLPQAKRLQVIDSFKRGSLTCLVATDVAARGIDVNDLSMVVNFDLPNEAENYVHRIGRTARAGKSGKAYTLCSEQDVYNLPAIEKYIEAQIPSCVAEGDMFAVDKSDGIYIHTGRYDDSGEFGKRSPRNSSRSGDKRVPLHSGSMERQKSGGKYSSPKTGGKSSVNMYAQKKTSAPEDLSTQDLSRLSFEERMKVYQQKYAGGSSARSEAERASTEKRVAPKKRNGKGAKNRNPAVQANTHVAVQTGPVGKKNEHVENRTQVKNTRNTKRGASDSYHKPPQTQPAVRPESRTVVAPIVEKKNLFGRIKAFFTK